MGPAVFWSGDGNECITLLYFPLFRGTYHLLQSSYLLRLLFIFLTSPHALEFKLFVVFFTYVSQAFR